VVGDAVEALDTFKSTALTKVLGHANCLAPAMGTLAFIILGLFRELSKGHDDLLSGLKRLDDTRKPVFQCSKMK